MSKHTITTIGTHFGLTEDADGTVRELTEAEYQEIGKKIAAYMERSMVEVVESKTDEHP